MRHLRRASSLGLAVTLGLLCLSPASARPPRNESSFILMHDSSTMTMSGDLRDLEHVRRAQKGTERLLWYRTAAGQEYLVRDGATLAQVDAAWKPVREVSEQQSRLGAKQNALGAQESKLGAKQSAIDAQLSPLEEELDGLSDRSDRGGTAAERDSNARRRRALEQQIHELEARSRELERQMRVFEPPMRELERQMDALDRKEEAAEKVAHAELDAVLARAIAAGTAKPFK